ncbi:uncharacterized protein LOC123553460 [Mercenaria mercenaria]|uniref:uncharacterized protein LOC123553460 n=1 Tax=Mercenaria mercenaria TaxID=6596 RepID=UPI00234F5C3C|nr:uncharacterized protein LOC123553460 [Mercenaria mercenaria]
MATDGNEIAVRCCIHAVKLLDMYCKDHDEVGCATCMASNHKSCKNVHSILDDIDILFEKSDIKAINQNLQQSKETLENIGQKKDAVLEGLDLSKNEANAAIENVKSEIVALVENIEKKSTEEVENVYQTAKTCVVKESNDVKHQVCNLEKVTRDIQTSDGNKAQQFVCMKIANKKIKEANEVAMHLKAETEPKIAFKIDQNMHAYFRNMATFGKVSGLMPNADITKLYTVEHYKGMNVKLQQDYTSCNIFDSCWIEDGLLLLVDANNKKLKRANITSMTVDGYCSFDKNPYGVCCTSKQEAVVTFYTRTNFIQFVSIGYQLTPSRKVEMNHNCFGIAYQDDKLYITDNAKTIYIHDTAGNELQAISQDSSGNSMFGNTRHIALNDSMQGIFVADWDSAVTILGEKYQPVASFSDSELSKASGVCVDDRGNIFVCGYRSYNVLQIGYDGKKRGVVVDKSHGLQYPRSVCFDPVQCRLIVTQDNDIVKICDLS